MSDEEEERGFLGGSLIPQNTVPIKAAPLTVDRITVVETISYASQEPGQVPAVSSKYTRLVQHTERPYQRTYKVTEESKPLDLGWAAEWEKISLLHVANEEGRFLQFIPTPKEVKATRQKIVQVGEWLVHPGESLRATPADIRSLTIRSLSGPARVTITIYPA